MSENHPAARLLRTAFLDTLAAASSHTPDPDITTRCGIPQQKWSSPTEQLIRLESFIRASERNAASAVERLADGLKRLPLLPVVVLSSTGLTRILGSSVELQIDTWVRVESSESVPPSGGSVAVGRLVSLFDCGWTFVIHTTLPAKSAEALSVEAPGLRSSRLNAELWRRLRPHGLDVLAATVHELERHRSSLLSEQERIRLMGVQYGLDKRLLLERGFFDDAGEFKQEEFPIRDLRMMLAEEDEAGIAEVVETARRFRNFVLGREPSDEELKELDSVWPLDHILEPWHAKADGTLTHSLAWAWRREPAEVLKIDAEHPVWQALGDNSSVAAAHRWATRFDDNTVADAVARFATESRWIATWGGAEELEAAAGRQSGSTYDQLRAAFIALFDRSVSEVLVRVNGRWKGVSEKLARALGLAPDEMTVARLPRSWQSLEALDVLSTSQCRSLTIEMARIACSWR